ncbi:hypothetical protein GCM10011322_18480 [Salinarimonas ramus]|uniref:TauD/TfdA-like domain-containing protein n=2 Tax=Salinarimonas ramus TaxID=690164 RepID=A0A917V3H3_9HYPH|nr:hypothetical protein GCM10011322_18480 [Salinarimonas ramus]
MPIASQHDQQSSASSSVTLEMHTELAFVDDPPDYVLLFCVRQDPNAEAETYLFDAFDAFNTIGCEDMIELSKDQFCFGTDINVTENLDTSVIDRSIVDLVAMRLMRYDVDLYKRTGSRADRAFDNLLRALVAVRTSIKLNHGQLIIIDNKRVVHSRSHFNAAYNGRDRWLKRSLVQRY